MRAFITRPNDGADYKISVNGPVAAIVIAGIGAGLVLALKGFQLPSAVVQALTIGVVSLLPPLFTWLRQEVVSITTTTTTTASSSPASGTPPSTPSSIA